MGNTQPGERNRSKKPLRAVSLLRAFLIGAAMALAFGALSYVLHLQYRFPDRASAQMFDRPLAFQISMYGVVSPVLEEILFRLILFDLVNKVLPERVSTVVVSALFALWHGNIVQMLYGFPAGLILQALRSQTCRMEEPILCHVGANLTAIAVSALQT